MRRFRTCLHFIVSERRVIMSKTLATLMMVWVSGAVLAAPAVYNIDPNHTYPSFEADHMGGLSVWRGKFTDTAGKAISDRGAKSGSIDSTVKVDSVEFGMAKMDEHAKSPEIFDAAKYPTAVYSGKFSKFNG